MTRQSPKIGKNAPCPCGSGKIYKRCCIGKQVQVATTEGKDPPAPDGQDQEVERRLIDLKATFQLPDRLGWKSFDFEVDLFDPVIDDVVDLAKDGWEQAPPEQLTVRMAFGMERHVTLRLRDRLAAALEEARKKGVGGRTRQLIAAALAGLEDLQMKPILIGCLHPLYQGYILGRVQQRLDFQREERSGTAAELAAYEQFVGVNDQAGLRGWLETQGERAVPWIERLFEDPAWRKGAIGLLSLIAGFPSLRVATLLAKAALDAGTSAPDGGILDCLRRTPAPVWPILGFRARHRESSSDLRLRAYAYLAAGGRWEVLDDLLAELTASGRWKQEMPEADFPRIADLVAQLADRRAVGRMVQFLVEGRLSDPARDAVRDACSPNGWWKEIEEALREHRGGALVFVPEGAQMTELLEERFDRDPPESMEAAQFRTGILNEEWNNAYHEGLEGLRPNDLAIQGPDEAALMSRWGEVVKERLMDLAERGFHREELRQEVSALEYDWMRTPASDWGGRLPLAVIWEERRERTPNRAYYEHEREKLLNDLYLWARDLFDDGEIDAAKRELETVLAIEPAYPFARRLLARLPGL